MTSSYFRTFLRISKFCCSTWVCADWIALETILASIGTSSSIRNRVMMDSTSGPLNRTMSSSRKER